MRTEGEVDDFEITRAWGDNAFSNSKDQVGGGGIKYGSCPWYGMDIFWNCPM